MVVLSAAVVKSGKTLVARQFVEMSRLRVEGLLSAFQKLVDTGKDHTFIETDTVRYVYRPMEALHMVLVTSKSSNILEDILTLQLLARVVQECCQIQVNEEFVLKNAFEIVFAFDEVVSHGHRENVSLSEIKSCTEMDSHEEKIHQMVEKSKISEARDRAKKAEMELRRAGRQQAAGGEKTGFGSEDGTPFGGVPSHRESMAPMISMGGGGMEQEPLQPLFASMADDAPALMPRPMPTKGMSLGRRRPGDVFGPPEPAAAFPGASAEAQSESAAVALASPLSDSVKVEIEEKITADLQVEGGLKGEVTCLGRFQVTVLHETKADLVSFKLAPQSQEFKYQPHPMLNKVAHANDVLEVRELSHVFKRDVPAQLLRWQLKTSDEGFLPISLSCWPTSTADGTQMIMELTLTDTDIALTDVHVRFPAAPSSRPVVASAEPGEAAYDAASQEVHWRIASLDQSESTGTMEFSAAADASALLPCAFQAIRRGGTRCPMEILECYHQERKDAISYCCEKSSTYLLRLGA